MHQVMQGGFTEAISLNSLKQSFIFAEPSFKLYNISALSAEL